MTNSTDSSTNSSLFSGRLFYLALLLIVVGVLYYSFRGVEQTIQTRTQYIQLQGKEQQVRLIEFKYRDIYHKAVQQDVQLVASRTVITDLLNRVDSLQAILNKRRGIRPVAYTRVHQKTVIQDVSIPYTDTTRYAMTDSLARFLTENPDGFVLVPKAFAKDSSLFSIRGKVHSRGISIDSLVIHNELSVQIGHSRKHFLAPYRSVVTAVNTNPLVENTLSGSVMVKPPKSRLHLGLQVGYGISLTQLKPVPYMGVGLTYQPF